jgi:hypothetical protein
VIYLRTGSPFGLGKRQHDLVVFFGFRALLELFPYVQFDRKNIVSVGNVTLMALCAIAIGLVAAAELNNGRFLGLLRKLRITKKTAKPSTWNEAWTHKQAFVVVHLNDGRRIYGWPTYYSDMPEERAILLENASWLGDDNNLLNEQPISIFLDQQTGIKLIEFVEDN